MIHHMSPAQRKAAKLMGLPQCWPGWPCLPVARDGPDGQEEGTMMDLFHSRGVVGYSATVFLVPQYKMPADEEDIAELPREVYDSAEEVAEAGWVPECQTDDEEGD